MQWNALWKEPEFNEAAKKVKERKEREARLAAEAKREADARLARYNMYRGQINVPTSTT